ncbi:MAG: ferritin-like protein [Thermoleophilia bacterium]|nr:ferritin-like protein [Thermoleophilia bacterium]
MSTSEAPMDIAEFDVDGALAQLEHDASEAVEPGTTRATFLKRFAVGAGGMVVASSLVGPAVAGAATSRRSERGDIEILQYALTLEYLEAQFYKEAVQAPGITGANKNFAKVVYAHEAAHVGAIIATLRKLGATPVSSPRFNFKGTNRKNGVFQKTALALEETGVAAYVGQAPYVLNEGVLLAAARIATVEARHAAWMRNMLGLNPAPRAFDAQRSKPGTLAVVNSTGFIV